MIIGAIVFLILCFIPMIKILDFSVPSILFLLPILFFKKSKIDKKNMKNIIICSVLMTVTYIPALVFHGNDTVKDLAYIIYPALLFLQSTILINMIPKKEHLVTFLKLFIIVQLVFCIFQFTNLFNTNILLKDIYEYWQEANYQKYGIWELSVRNFGTVGSPIFLSIICYLFSKVIQKETNSFRYIILAVMISLMAGARLPLLAIIVIEVIDLLINRKITIKKKALFCVVIATLIIIAINCFPFVTEFFNLYIIGSGDIMANYSFTYRQSMYSYMIDNKSYLLFGGYGIENFPGDADSEYVLRLLQLGIVNFLIVIYQYYYLIKDLKTDKNNKKATYEIIFFLLACMSASNILTNIYMMQFVLLSIIAMKKTCLVEEVTHGE